MPAAATWKTARESSLRVSDMGNDTPVGDREDDDSPPCVLDEQGHSGHEALDEQDPLYHERHGLHGAQKDAMHDGEKEGK